MIFHKTKIEGLYIIETEPKTDERGYLSRIFAKEELVKMGLNFDILHVNLSWTKKKGTIRGLHFQKEPKPEDKIIACLKGAIYDVAIDLRRDSPTFGQWSAAELTEENNKLFYVSRGLAHGFQALIDDTKIIVLASECYYPELAAGVRWNDSVLNISWPIKNPIVSEKDKGWPPMNIK